MSTSIVKREPVELVEWSEDRIALLKRTIAKGSTDDEFQLFLSICKRTQLDPFMKQIYAVKRWSAVDKKEVMSAQISIDGLRLVAERSGEYVGQEGPYWCDESGVWKEVWLSNKAPVASKVIVYKRGSDKGFPAVAHWNEYVQTKKDGSVTNMWTTKGALMLAKCAESLALRKAFPQDVSGLYTPEEYAVLEQGEKQGLPMESGTEIHVDTKPTTIPKIQMSELLSRDYVIPSGKLEGVALSSKPDQFWVEYLDEVHNKLQSMPDDYKKQAQAILVKIQTWLERP